MNHNDNQFRYVCSLNNSLLEDNKALDVRSGDRVYLVFNLKRMLTSPIGSHDFVTGQSITNVNLKRWSNLYSSLSSSCQEVYARR